MVTKREIGTFFCCWVGGGEVGGWRGREEEKKRGESE